MTKKLKLSKEFKRLLPTQRGSLLITVLAMMIILTTIGLGVMTFVSSQYSLAVNDTYNVNATSTAEAGVEMSLYNLNQSASFTGYSTEQQLFNDPTQGKGTYTSVVAPVSGSNAKTITTTGKVYRYNTNKVISTRKVKVTVVGTGSPGYAVHTGPGGLILTGSANITNADVYVNGYISLSGASKIGTASQPLKVNVANDQCPPGNSPGASYPTVCASSTGLQPITMAQSTAIYGTVCATGQTSTGPNNNIKPGNTGSGLVAGCTAPIVSTPTYDKASQVAAVTTTASGSDNAYTCQSWPFNRTWPANLKLTGNVSIASSCNLVIKGNTYITGNLDIGGAATITVDNSVGATRPVIIVDGTITLGGSARILANSSGTGAQFISFKSSASCSPNCTSLSGNDLKTSQALQTVSIGGAVNLPGMIFQSYWGKISIGGSGSLGSAIGQTVDMSGAGTVTFGTTLSSGSTTWTVTSYQRLK